jgi:hypothetical protein
MRYGKQWTVLAALLAAGLAIAGCGASGSDGQDGKDGAPGPVGPPGPPGPAPAPLPIDTELEAGEPLPGALLTITGLSGATGANGQFRVGDTLSATFTLTLGDGTTPLPLTEMDSGSIYVSGPTTHYQRVLPRATDLRTRAVRNLDGSWTYTFATPFPAVYAAPYNDTASFGAGDGELAGQPLENGTYTLGIEAYKSYFEGASSFRDPVNVTRDFLFGTAMVLQPRDVAGQANCNQCHETLQAHGGFRREVALCVLCHTAGAEDRNSPAVAGGTPGVSIEFSVMVHRIHNAKHLPSVLGVGTTDLVSGDRNYLLPAKPLQYAGFSTTPVDLSEVAFPVWPNLNVPMPRDAGYMSPSMTPEARAQEDEMRRGVTSCAKCHGDPDGTGPKAAPAQGDNAYTNQTRRACGSCHDDVDWTGNYKANGVTMMAQANDANCLVCHPASGTPLSPIDGHRHPLLDTAFHPGLNFAVASVTEGPGGNGNGKVDPLEKVLVNFTLKNDAGADVPVNTLNSMTALVSGPTTNAQLLLNASVPVAYYGAGPNYSVALPQVVPLEYLGTSTGGGNDTFATARTPHWNLNGGATSVFTVGAVVGGGNTTASAAAPAFQNFVDVASAANFARNDYLVIDEGTANEEYLRVQTVEGTRLWFNSIGSLTTYAPFLRFPHGAGATVREVSLTTRTAGTHYALTAATGQIAEMADGFGANKVLVSYTTDFTMPARYPAPYNDTPSLDETWGEWAGMPLVDGTYTVTLYGGINRTFSASGENTSYNGVSQGGTRDFLVGGATALVAYDAIAGEANCYRCHDDIFFHGGGRRGFATCIGCHGASGFEDRPRYVAPGAPETAATPVSFRTMIHKIHFGHELPEGAGYQVVGFGNGAYPNNYGVSTYEHVGFPAFPDGAKDCAVCHGAANTRWQSPPDRTHPAGQARATRSWRATCGACHSSTDAAAHFDAMTAVTTTGAESCGVCHGPGKEWNVPKSHTVR